MPVPKCFEIVLVEPQIPPNTGNIARLCAALRLPLHLVGKLGFELTDRYLKRAGLDYWEHVELHVHPDIEKFFDSIPGDRLHFYSNNPSVNYLEVKYRKGVYLVFGSETEGLPEWIWKRYTDRFVSIPMFERKVRSLNLSSAVAVAAYEALRQTGQLRQFSERE
jgi:tRNA (cytidine/uridine-2'-O-)-methyltransferase